ncbi:hypothetical protein BS618_23075 [Rhodococcus erythropolis]|nr:hypothetical protein BS618_23075 [Rhodococcus erythropolis]
MTTTEIENFQYQARATILAIGAAARYLSNPAEGTASIDERWLAEHGDITTTTLEHADQPVNVVHA